MNVASVGARVVALALALGACGGSAQDAASGTNEQPAFRFCRERAFTPAPRGTFEHTESVLLSLASDPLHSAEDVVVAPRVTPRLSARFSYGLLATDLEDETVRVTLDDCRGFRSLGDHRTDEDGALRLDAPGDLGPGVYAVHYQVLGDQTTTTSYVWVLPLGTRMVVTDIDGTLTASDSELFEQVLDGSHVPEAYPGAVELTASHFEQGYVVVYLTGRPYFLSQRTRDWTKALGFAPGPLFLARTTAEALPGEDGVGTYKLARLDDLSRSYPLDYAYGNASTDLFAYLAAGFDPAAVFIIGEHAGEQGTRAAIDSWDERVTEVKALAPVEQPFVWPAR